jgi:Ca2+-binding RTX toxin-like protein
MAEIFETSDAPAGASTSYIMAPGDIFRGTILLGGDRDWVATVLDGGYGYFARVSGDGSASSLPGTSITLRDASGQSLTNSGNSQGASGAGLNVGTGGTFHIDVGAWSSSQSGTYVITLLQETAGTTATRDSVAIGGTYSGAIDYGNDSDWVRVTLNPNYGYYFRVDGDGSANSLGGTSVTLYSASGQSITNSGNSSGGAGVALATTQGGVHYIGVSAWSSSSTGGYRLQVIEEVAAGTSTLSSVAVGDTFASAIDYGNDRDWVRVILDDNYGYYFRIDGDGSATSLANTSIAVHNASGQQLVTEGSSVGGSGVAIQASTAGIHYMNAGAWSSSSTGGYQVSVLQEIASGNGTREGLSIGGSRTSTIDYRNDRDWFRVEVDSGYDYYFRMSGDSTATAISGTDIRIHSISGQQITSAGSSAGASGASVYVTEPTTLYVNAGAWSSTATGSYTVSALREIASGAATRATLTTGPGQASRVDYGGDRDWFRMTLDEGYGYVFRMEGDGSGTSLGSSSIVLRSASGASLATGGTSSGPGFLGVNISESNTFYLDLGAWTSSATGGYRTTVQREIAGNTGTRAELSLGTPFASRLDYAGDTDWFRVTLQAGVEYRITAKGDGGATSMLTSSLRVMGAAGNELAQRSNFNGLNEFVYVPTTTGTHYIYVGSNSVGAAGVGYLVSVNGPEVIGGPGNDTLTGSNFAEELIGLGGNDRLFGLGGNDRLFGGAGNDILDGGAGNDTMDGGLGNDRYVVDSIGDVIVGEIGFSQGGGIDTVEAWINYTLPTNIEILRLQGSANLNGFGNFAPEALVGNTGNNLLDGGGGNDVLNGKDGNDTLIGGLGADSLVGEAGRDVFVFRNVNESRPGQANRDFINGFENGLDRIDLSQIDANSLTTFNDAFTFIGTAAFSGVAGQLRWFTFGGGNFNIVEADVNGDRVADMQIFVNLTNVMEAGDFIL